MTAATAWNAITVCRLLTGGKERGYERVIYHKIRCCLRESVQDWKPDYEFKSLLELDCC